MDQDAAAIKSFNNFREVISKLCQGNKDQERRVSDSNFGKLIESWANFMETAQPLIPDGLNHNNAVRARVIKVLYICAESGDWLSSYRRGFRPMKVFGRSCNPFQFWLDARYDAFQPRYQALINEVQDLVRSLEVRTALFMVILTNILTISRKKPITPI